MSGLQGQRAQPSKFHLHRLFVFVLWLLIGCLILCCLLPVHRAGCLALEHCCSSRAADTCHLAPLERPPAQPSSCAQAWWHCQRLQKACKPCCAACAACCVFRNLGQARPAASVAIAFHWPVPGLMIYCGCGLQIQALAPNPWLARAWSCSLPCLIQVSCLAACVTGYWCSAVQSAHRGLRLC